MSDAIEAALSSALEKSGRIVPDGADREIETLRAQVATYEDAMEACRSTIVDLHSRLADCQAVIRSRGHEADCPTARCVHCRQKWVACREYDGRIPHAFRASPCSDACGHDRTTGEKA